MRDLLAKIKNIVKWAKVTKSIPDTEAKPGDYVSYLKKENVSACLITPYGFFSKPPVGMHVFLFSANGNEGSRVGISCALSEREKNLEVGESGIVNLVTGVVIKLDKDGNVHIKNAQKIIIESSPVNIDVLGADVNIDNANNVNVNANKVNLGSGGQPIARLGDAVQVNTGTGTGTITGGGTNTSI